MNFRSDKRERNIAEARRESFDVIIIGGGIHGACVARHAALAGYRVLLLEAKDFAFGTSSRSSKMLHGGVRYLESGDISLVHEALVERSIIIKSAPHLARVQEFLFPIIHPYTKPRWQVRLGLSLYDLLAKSLMTESLFPKHRVLENDSEEAIWLREMGLRFHSLLSYFDGQMDDARLVIENIVDANSLGAITLNHAQVESIASSAGKGDKWEISWRDTISGESCASSGKFLVNLSGPWFPKLDKLVGAWKPSWPKPIYSRGTHLLFNLPWRGQKGDGQGLILPTGIKGRYYFIWPHFSPYREATLVGTTDTLVSENEDNPIPSEDEIAELLGFLQRDLPHANLNAKNLFHSFCGIRMLASSKHSPAASQISRKDVFIQRPGYVALLGGKFTTARKTAEKICKVLDQYLDSNRASNVSTAARPLPGGVSFDAAAVTESLIEAAVKNIGDKTLAAKLAERAVKRLGSRSQKLIELEKSCSADANPNFSKIALTSELRLFVEEEHAITEEDILNGRLGYQYSCDESS